MGSARDIRVDRLQLAKEARSRSPRALPRVTRSALRLVWRASRSGFLISATFQILSAAMVTLLVFASKLIVEGLLEAESGESSTASIVPVIVLVAVATSLMAAAAGLHAQQQRWVGERVAAVVWDDILDVTTRVDLEYYESPRFFEQLKRVELNAVGRPVMVCGAVFGLIGGMLGAIGLVAATLTVEPLLLPVLLAGGLPAVYLTRRAARTEFGFAVVRTPVIRRREYLRSVLKDRDPAKEVRAFGAESALRDRYTADNRTVQEAVRRQVRLRQRYVVVIALLNAAALVGALIMVVHFISTGRMTLPEAGAAVVGVRMLPSRLNQMTSAAGTLFESSVFLEDLERFTSLSATVESAGTGNRVPHEREIVLSDVRFSYPGSDVAAVSGVDLRIAKGEIVALVGENGSGKTTLAKMIAGLYRPTGGMVTWDGLDVGELAGADVRRSVAVIFQDFVRYQLSALENIGLGEPDTVEDEVAARRAAELAGAATFLEKLPDGYRTVLSRELSNGSDLSVGQWQRVALARAIRRDAPLVILDEPTAALDPRAEHDLFADIREMLQGRSALLISHRYSSVRTADRIYVMESGKIVESGSHDDLMDRAGLYAELFTLQARAYL